MTAPLRGSGDSRTTSILNNILSNNLQIISLIVISGLMIVMGGYFVAPSSKPDSPVVTPTMAAISGSLPTPEPSATILGSPRPECVPIKGQPYIEVKFRISNLSAGMTPWLFGRSSGNPKFYPSEDPTAYTGGEYTALVYVGPAERYSVHIFLLNSTDKQDVSRYIAARKQDEQWSLGLQLPSEARGLLDRDSIQGCSALGRTPSPQTQPLVAR